MRILGLDYGSKTVGVAVTDPLGLTVQGLETIERAQEKHLRRTFRRIGELIGHFGAEAVVLGLPLNMDDTEGDRALKTCVFREELRRRFGVPVIFVDERLTTVSAEEILEESGVRKSDYKKYVDKIAAVLILEDFMASYGKDLKEGRISLRDLEK
ncbi:MAG: Holliday junction resolvase RuvX [Lachnospiraceae bacterium]|nr:Holliday junction resolvase RuvX [Lachnospiraceae bacterium]